MTMARSRNGQAIRRERQTKPELRRLDALISNAKRDGDLFTWRRSRAVMNYLCGEKVVDLSKHFGVGRSSVNRWLKTYDMEGADGLRARKRPGAASRLSGQELFELSKTLKQGPTSAGYMSGVWTGPMIGDLIERQYGVKYHNHHIPRLLHKLGYCVQRPRKRLARADPEKQALWVEQRFPEIKKS